MDPAKAANPDFDRMKIGDDLDVANLSQKGNRGRPKEEQIEDVMRSASNALDTDLSREISLNDREIGIYDEKEDSEESFRIVPDKKIDIENLIKNEPKLGNTIKNLKRLLDKTSAEIDNISKMKQPESTLEETVYNDNSNKLQSRKKEISELMDYLTPRCEIGDSNFDKEVVLIEEYKDARKSYLRSPDQDLKNLFVKSEERLNLFREGLQVDENLLGEDLQDNDLKFKKTFAEINSVIDDIKVKLTDPMVADFLELEESSQLHFLNMNIEALTDKLAQLEVNGDEERNGILQTTAKLLKDLDPKEIIKKENTWDRGVRFLSGEPSAIDNALLILTQASDKLAEIAKNYRK